MSSTQIRFDGRYCKRVDDKIRLWIVNGTVICSSTAICAVEHLRLDDIFRPGSSLRLRFPLFARRRLNLVTDGEPDDTLYLFSFDLRRLPATWLASAFKNIFAVRWNSKRSQPFKFYTCSWETNDAANRTVYKSPRLNVLVIGLIIRKANTMISNTTENF